MNQQNEATPPFTSDGSGAIMLPCEPSQFREFIAGLLGQPQTIVRRLKGPFEVNRHDIESLYHLIDQRLISQNEATLIQFTARIAYDDNSSVLINSIRDFEAYNEIKPLCSEGIQLSWTYLIKFRNKKFPEKQTIEVGFTADHGGADFDTIVRAKGITISTAQSGIRIKISHTDRTWGADIDALLSGHLQLLQKPVGKLRALAFDHSGKISALTSLFVFLCSLVGTYLITSYFVERYLAIATNLKSETNQNFDSVAKKIDFLIGIIASGMWTRYAIYVMGLLLVSIIVAIVSAILVSTFAEKERPSFVLLTKKAEDKKVSAMKKYENGRWLFIVSIVGSLLLSMIGNYLFYKLTQYWTL